MPSQLAHPSVWRRPVAWASIVALASLAVALWGYGAWELAGLNAALGRHEPPAALVRLALLGAAQLPIGLTLAVLGGRRRRAAGPLALAWAGTLVLMIGTATAAGFRFEELSTAAAYIAAVLVMALAAWRLGRVAVAAV